MNPERGTIYVGTRLFEREEKLKQIQVYKRKNQQHPAFKKK